MTPKTARLAADNEGRDTDANVRQRRAAEPSSSVWVNASAGTGKTKVLTDRILRLLLPGKNGAPGTKPHKILGLTFTKAAASEMTLRLGKRLSEWAIQSEEDLQKSLRELLGRDAQAEELTAARRLFAQIVDTPGGLKIMTIHSFCQSVLGRFPLEAGIAPNMTVLEEGEADRLLRAALEDALRDIQTDKAGPLAGALARIAGVLGEDRFEDMLRSIAGERRQLRDLTEHHFGMNGLYDATCAMLGVPAGKSPEDIIAAALQETGDEILHGLQSCLAQSKTAEEVKRCAWLKTWLGLAAQERIREFELYKNIFLTKDNNPWTRGFPSKDTTKSYPHLSGLIAGQAERLIRLLEQVKSAACALHTRDLLHIGFAVIEHYQLRKQQMGALDYDDLIFRTLDLLEEKTATPRAQRMSAWVLYKLDAGIDHMLIDEAQDTNPEQWKIIRALSNELHAGLGAREQTRTLFAVGDEKQSIYSFQRASPEEFSENHAGFEQKFTDAGHEWQNVDLDISFRSAQSVLDAVDATFSDPAARVGMGEHEILHRSFRIGEAGRVELWPLVDTEKAAPYDPWEPPIAVREKQNGSAKLAQDIAQKIAAWIDTDVLPARGRKIRPGDIMILVRTRNVFVEQLSRALKQAGVPVSGTDRMVLSKHIAVQDLLAFAEFALAPHDDLTLACILKSPLIGFSEEDLYKIAQGRGEISLWQSLRKSFYKETAAFLERVKNTSHGQAPFDFLSGLLQNPCPADTVSGLRAVMRRLGADARDPLDELLAAALNFERTSIASLQAFTHAQRGAETEIRREHEDHAGEVRIMTVHGAKGLQAPIIILSDTIRSVAQGAGKASARLLWPNKSELPVPLWSPLKDMDCALYTQAAARVNVRLDNEYRRLLYVAMTRAEDRLYIGGATTLKPALPSSWYFLAKTGLEKLTQTQILEDGTLRLENEQARDAKKNDENPATVLTNEKMPQWIFTAAESETDARILSLSPSHAPGRPGEQEQLVWSPLQKAEPYRFRRGKITHRLLEILPVLPQTKRADAARRFVDHYGADLPAYIRKNIMEETLSVLAHPDFSAVFGKNSLAEVPVTGMVDGQKISGRIDRLLVREKTIHIIDYKTNRPPPKTPVDIPALYKRQLQAYADLMRQVYPGRTIEAALLWTDGPTLMPVPLNKG
ncbi:MAG: double-strand break repair helicase AddA [Alphaproteobacteria bacterium]